jgi:hypothetical protein
MDFREATENLCAGVSHEDLAKTLGVSVATVRQARLRQDAKAHRNPPVDWRDAVIKLAESRARRYARLAENLRNEDRQAAECVAPPETGRAASAARFVSG